MPSSVICALELDWWMEVVPFGPFPCVVDGFVVTVWTIEIVDFTILAGVEGFDAGLAAGDAVLAKVLSHVAPRP